jgi:WD40 repeat protein
MIPTSSGGPGGVGHQAQQQPAWLAEGIAPSLAELREAKQRDRADVTRKRLRAPLAIEPQARRLHQLIATQLHHDGYAEAAASVMRATGCLAPLTAEGRDGQRLSRLVRLGETAERVRAPHPSAGAGTSGHGGGSEYPPGSVECALFGGSVYTDALPAEAVAFGEIYSSLPLDRPLRCTAFSPRGEYIACGATNGCVRIFSGEAVAERARLGEGADRAAPSQHGMVRTINAVHDQSVEWIGFHPTAPVLVSAGRDGRLCLVDYAEPQGRPAVEHMPVGAPGRRGATSAEANATVKGADSFTSFRDNFPIRAAAIHPGGEYIALATDHSTLRMVSLRTGSLLCPSEGHNAAIADVCFNADGRSLATASYDGTWRVCDGRTGTTTHAPPTAASSAMSAAAAAPSAHCGVAVTSCQLSASGNVLLTTGADNQTKLWDLRKTSTELGVFGEAKKVPRRLRSRFTFDESAVAVDSSDRRGTEIIDVFSGVTVATLKHAQVQRGLACSPAAQVVATCGDDYRLRLWSPTALTLLLPEDDRAGGGRGGGGA